MNEQNYTSLELSKKLAEAGCTVHVATHWRVVEWDKGDDSVSFRYFHEAVGMFEGIKNIKEIPAYDILNDICVKYAKEFFGKEFIPVDNHLTMVGDPAYIHHPIEILLLMQRGKKQEVELYIWENCLFNPKNKG